MREAILAIFPEIEWIEDESLRVRVIRTYERALREGGWAPADMERIPFTLLVDTELSYADHVRAVTRIAHAVYEAFLELFGDRVPLKRDILLAGALLHDVGKLVEIEEHDGKFQRSAGGKILRHPFSGAALAYAERLPPEVLHIIAAHSKEGDPHPRTPEGAVVHHVDFICFEAVKG
jgi:putative nucleotidyltransferase with HDIG domain